jgi:hypothetical protein
MVLLLLILLRGLRRRKRALRRGWRYRLSLNHPLLIFNSNCQHSPNFLT